jgi:NADH-quinone oxidoreductase subunit J
VCSSDLAVLFSVVIISEIIYLTVVKTVKGNLVLEPSSANNTEAIGDVLYTKFFIDFQLSGIVLLLAMIGAIVLTHIYKPTIKRQNISHQNSVTRLERVSLQNPKSGEGIDA